MNVQFSSDQISVFLLVLARVGGLVSSAPIVGDAQVPKLVKVGLVIVLTIVLVQVPSIQHMQAPTGLYPFTLSVLAQLFVGLALGFVARILFLVMSTAGGIISLQIGLSMSMVLNPMTESADSVMTQFYTITAGLTFLAMNGELWLVAALSRSFDLAPLTPSSFSPVLVQTVVSDLLVVAQASIQIAMPVAATLFASDLILGVASRALPQLNVFILSMPLNIMLGLMAMIGSLAGTVLIVGHLTDQVPNVMLDLVSHT